MTEQGNPSSASPKAGDDLATTLPPPPQEDDRPFSIIDYLVVNALFLGFLLITYLCMISLFKDTAGLTSFFIILGVGFAAVSVYDFVFDRLHRTPASPDRTSPGQG